MSCKRVLLACRVREQTVGLASGEDEQGWHPTSWGRGGSIEWEIECGIVFSLLPLQTVRSRWHVGRRLSRRKVLTRSYILLLVCPGAMLEIATGYYHTCARGLSQVLCWGRNDNGQLGTGDYVAVKTPKAVSIDNAGWGKRFDWSDVDQNAELDGREEYLDPTR